MPLNPVEETSESKVFKEPELKALVVSNSTMKCKALLLGSMGTFQVTVGVVSLIWVPESGLTKVGVAGA